AGPHARPRQPDARPRQPRPATPHAAGAGQVVAEPAARALGWHTDPAHAQRSGRARLRLLLKKRGTIAGGCEHPFLLRMTVARLVVRHAEEAARRIQLGANLAGALRDLTLQIRFRKP